VISTNCKCCCHWSKYIMMVVDCRNVMLYYLVSHNFQPGNIVTKCLELISVWIKSSGFMQLLILILIFLDKTLYLHKASHSQEYKWVSGIVRVTWEKCQGVACDSQVFHLGGINSCWFMLWKPEVKCQPYKLPRMKLSWWNLGPYFCIPGTNVILLPYFVLQPKTGCFCCRRLV